MRIAYTASSDSHTLTAPNNTTITFGPGDVVPAQPNSTGVITWQKISGTTVDRLTFAVPMVNNVPLSYTLVGTWITNQANAPGGHSRIAVGGAPTISTDMPRSGSATYTSGVGGAALQGGSNYILTGHSSGTFSANFGTGAITTGLTLAGTLTPTDPTVVAFGSFTGTGTIASGGSGYSGTLGGTAANGATATGGFSGGFFGPQALETAFGYSFSAGSLTAVGALVGVKQ